MSILLTSFKKSLKLKGKSNIEFYSVSRWQPSNFFYPSLDFLGAYNKNKQRLFLKGRNNPLQSYQHDLFEYYVSQWKKINSWLTSLNNNDKLIVLCCWCPYSNSTKKQIQNFGSFACHTGLIGKIINKYCPEETLYLDIDRHKQLVQEWKPKNYKLMEV